MSNNTMWMWHDLQLFADGGDGGGDGGAAATATGETAASAPAAGESRLRELGVPESVLAKRAKRAAKRGAAATAAPQQTAEPKAQAAAVTETAPTEGEQNATQQQETAPKRMTWEEIMADPEYNKSMQQTIQARLRSAKGAEESLAKLAPAIELLTRKYGLDGQNLDAEALAKAISDDDDYYEEKALEMGVPLETAKKIDQQERETARRNAEEARSVEQQRIQQHIAKLQQQGEELKKTFKNFDLMREMQNPTFARMTSPSGGISVEDAYYAIHRKEIQSAAMQVTARKTAQQMANAIRSGQQRPMENGVSAQAPSNTTFDYAHASREQREALKKQIREAAARGQKIYPGQR